MTDYLQQEIDYRQADVTQAFDETMLWSARFGSLMLDNLKPVKNIRILDVGCGTGFPLFELAQRFGASCEVVGVDPWEEAMRRAAFKRDVYGLTNVELITDDIVTAPLADASFDLITSNLGINNFENPPAALQTCYRVAKSGATFMVTTNIKGHFAEFYAVYRDLLTSLGQTDALERLTQHENHRRTREEVVALIEKAGFRVTHALIEPFYYRFADGSALLRHWFMRLGFLAGWRSVVSPTDEVDIFSRLEDQLNHQGEIRLTVPMLLVESRK